MFPRAIAAGLRDGSLERLAAACRSLGGDAVPIDPRTLTSLLERVDPARNSDATLHADIIAVDARDTEIICHIIARRAGGRGDGALLAVATQGDPPATLVEACAAGADDAVVATDLVGRGGGIAIEKSLALGSRRRAQHSLHNELRRAADAALERVDTLTKRVTRLESEAWTDALTGLANRRQLTARLERMFAEAVRYASDLSCVVLDLDGFKGLNDTRGHGEGDACLRRVARAINESVRASDVAARYGGDEFVLLMPRTPIGEAARVAERLRDRFYERSNSVCDDDVEVGVSIGVASVEASKPLNGEGLIDAADRAMYASKADGGRHVMLCRADGEMVAV